MRYLTPILSVARGVFKGEARRWAMAPPLGRQDRIISIDWYTKLRNVPPPL